MMEITRLKKTRQIVYPMGAAGSNHTLVLFPFSRNAKSGQRGHIQPVRNDNLITDREIMS